MARTTDGTSSHYILRTTAISGLAGGATATMSVWLYRASSGTTSHCGTAEGTTNGLGFEHWSDNNIYSFARNGAAGFDTTDSTIVSSGWHHYVLVYDGTQSALDRLDVYYDGVKQTMNHTGDDHGATMGSMESMGWGHDTSTGSARYTAGSYAETAWYDDVLTPAEIASLASGVTPVLIRPRALVHYWPLVDTTQDVVGGEEPTLTGTTVLAHPRVINPTAQILQFPPPAAPAGGNEPLFYHHQRMLSRCS